MVLIVHYIHVLRQGEQYSPVGCYGNNNVHVLKQIQWKTQVYTDNLANASSRSASADWAVEVGLAS